jgi:hypothetical protein
MLNFGAQFGKHAKSRRKDALKAAASPKESNKASYEERKAPYKIV